VKKYENWLTCAKKVAENTKLL